VIILDYHLDGIDKSAINGIETLDKIKAINPDIPVIMLLHKIKSMWPSTACTTGPLTM